MTTKMKALRSFGTKKGGEGHLRRGQEFDALSEARANELEARGFVTYRGTWDEALDYARGAMVTHAGSTWIATGPCAKGARPARAAEWRLAVKGGEVSKGPVTV